MPLAERERDLLLLLGVVMDSLEVPPLSGASSSFNPPEGGGVRHVEAHAMEPGRVVVVPGKHHRDDLAIVARERDAGRIEGPEFPLEAPAPREVVRERQAREGEVRPACERHRPSPHVRHGHHERDREVVEPVRLVGGS